VPPDQSSWDRYSEMVAVNLAHERSIVEDAVHAGPNATPAEQRVGAYYAACMDEAAVDARGLAPVQGALAKIDAIKTARDAMDVVTDFHVHWVETVFATYPGTDPRDSKRRVLWIDKGKLSLPDPSDYSKTDDAAVALRAKYVEHLTRLFGLAGLSPDDAKAAAARDLAFETALATSALSAADRRQREKQVHPMTVAELAKRWPSIDWKTYFAKLGVPAIDAVNVAQPAWMDAVEAALSAKDLAGVRAYLRMQVLRPESVVLPSAIEA
jgi:endothelin-converting enzyme/putative endopeptidase